jgi:hypothetical protein
MKMMQATLALMAFGLFGCGDRKSRSFFASDGISIGVPVMMSAGNYRIPVDFETEIVHSGQWIDTVQTEVDGTDILVTAVFTHANRESRYPDYVVVTDVNPGVYNLKYRDPDGVHHFIEAVTLP